MVLLDGLYYLGGDVTDSPQGLVVFFTPKGWLFSAQGNALGTGAPPDRSALKGRKNASRPGLIAPFQGWGRVAASLPRAMPWAEKGHPFGMKKDDIPRKECVSSPD